MNEISDSVTNATMGDYQSKFPTFKILLLILIIILPIIIELIIQNSQNKAKTESDQSSENFDEYVFGPDLFSDPANDKVFVITKKNFNDVNNAQYTPQLLDLSTGKRENLTDEVIGEKYKNFLIGKAGATKDYYYFVEQDTVVPDKESEIKINFVSKSTKEITKFTLLKMSPIGLDCTIKPIYNENYLAVSIPTSSGNDGNLETGNKIALIDIKNNFYKEISLPDVDTNRKYTYNINPSLDYLAVKGRSYRPSYNGFLYIIDIKNNTPTKVISYDKEPEDASVLWSHLGNKFIYYNNGKKMIRDVSDNKDYQINKKECIEGDAQWLAPDNNIEKLVCFGKYDEVYVYDYKEDAIERINFANSADVDTIDRKISPSKQLIIGLRYILDIKNKKIYEFPDISENCDWSGASNYIVCKKNEVNMYGNKEPTGIQYWPVSAFVK